MRLEIYWYYVKKQTIVIEITNKNYHISDNNYKIIII